LYPTSGDIETGEVYLRWIVWYFWPGSCMRIDVRLIIERNWRPGNLEKRLSCFIRWWKFGSVNGRDVTGFQRRGWHLAFGMVRCVLARTSTQREIGK